MISAPRKLPFLLLPLLAVSGALLPFNSLEWWAQDRLAAIQAKEPSNDIIIVAIDEKSLSRLGRWPWPRELLADSIDKLRPARTLGVTLTLAEPSADPQSDRILAQAIRQHGNVVLPAIVENNGGQLQETLPLPMLASAARGIGMIDYPADPDGNIRRTYLASGIGAAHWPAYAWLLSGGSPPSGNNNNHLMTSAWQNNNEHILPSLAGNDGYPTVSIVDVIDSPVAIEAVRDKTVLIGVTASGLGDHHQTPILGYKTAANGVIINAAATQALQQHTTLQRLELWYALPVITLLALLWECLALRRHTRRPLLKATAFSGLLLLLMLLLQLGWQRYLPLLTLAILVPAFTLLDQLLQQNHLKRLAFTDKLTGLANRHQFDDRFIMTLQECQHKQQNLTLLLLDVDHFKRYNDFYGHASGDDALRALASVLLKVGRNKAILPARIGGEEFAILAPEYSSTQAMQLAAEVRHELLILQLPHEKSPLGRLSCSIGIVSVIPDRQDNTRQLFELADQALYRAKNTGRDKAEIAGQATSGIDWQTS